MSKSIMESVRDYMLKCPLLHDGTLNIDYLPEEIAYSINTIQCDPVYKKYADGNNLRQFMFSVESKEAYGSDVIQNIENSGFYQRLEEWVTNNNLDGILPDLEGYTPQEISCTYNGSLMYNDVNLGVYQIQFRLLYI